MSGWVKVCGVTDVADAVLVADAGADAVGINLWPASPRAVELARAQEIADAVRLRLEVVVVTVDLAEAELRHLRATLRPHRLQLHGEESDALVEALQPEAVKAIGLRDAADVERALRAAGDWVLVDARDDLRRGGTGVEAPHRLAAEVCATRRTVLAGGLGVDNVAARIRACRPFGVDAASRLETAPGRKDPDAVRQFVAAARAAFAQLENERGTDV